MARLSTLSKLVALAVVLLSADVAQAEMKCKMRYDVRSYMTWYDFGSNIVLGLYNDPPASVEECPRCQSLGNHMS